VRLRGRRPSHPPSLQPWTDGLPDCVAELGKLEVLSVANVHVATLPVALFDHPSLRVLDLPSRWVPRLNGVDRGNRRAAAGSSARIGPGQVVHRPRRFVLPSHRHP